MALVTRADGATVTHKGNPAKKKTHFLKVKKEKQLTRDTEMSMLYVHKNSWSCTGERDMHE